MARWRRLTELPVSGRVAVRQIPPAELAVSVHKGPAADLDQTYGALGTYVGGA